MDRFYLQIICASVVLLLAAVILASPKRDAGPTEAQRAPLLRVVPR